MVRQVLGHPGIAAGDAVGDTYGQDDIGANPMSDLEELWTEVDYCEKHEYESLPCHDCRIEELEAQLAAANARADDLWGACLLYEKELVSRDKQIKAATTRADAAESHLKQIRNLLTIWRGSAQTADMCADDLADYFPPEQKP